MITIFLQCTYNTSNSHWHSASTILTLDIVYSLSLTLTPNSALTVPVTHTDTVHSLSLSLLTQYAHYPLHSLWLTIHLDWTATWEMWGKKTLKVSLEHNARKIKDLEDSLSKCSVPPIVNSHTGMQAHNTTGRSPNAQKLDGQTQTSLLRMPQTPPTDKRTTSLLSTTTDTTTDSFILNSEQSKQASTNKTPADSSAKNTIPDIRVNRSRQVPPSLWLP